MHYFTFHIGDYISHTSHLTEKEDLGFRRLLDLYYMSEKPIPNDLKKVCRLIRMRDSEAEIQQVLEEFFVLDGEEWRSVRADEEIAKYRSKADAARENGKKGGRPKGSTKPKKTQSVNLANPEKSGSKANQEPITNNHKPNNNGASPKSPAIPYDLIQSAYNSRLGKLRGSRILSDKTKKQIVEIWKSSAKHRSIEFWDWFFYGINRVDNFEFLSGNNDRSWTANLEYLTRNSVFAELLSEIIEKQESGRL